MIDPIKREKTISNDTMLPPAWLRRHQTAPDTGSKHGRLMRIGPDHAGRAGLVETINNAQEVVLASTFLLADDLLAQAFLDAVERDVRVYLLTASDSQVAKIIREEGEFDARMVDEHKKLLDQLAGKVLLRSAEHFHAKFIVADPMTEPNGWLSTANFNLALRESVELLVQFSHEEAKCAADWFSWAFWLEADKELVEKGRLSAVKSPPADPEQPTSASALVTTTQHQALRGEALRLIQRAKSELLVSSFGLAVDHPVVQAIAEKARSGVDVTVFTRPRPAVLPAVVALRKAGATVIAHDKLHAKAIWSEAGGLVMSANLERHGLDQSFEMGIALAPDDATRLREILVEWRDAFPWSFESSASMQSHLGEVCLADQGLRSGRRNVIEEHGVNLKPVEAEDALMLDDAPEPSLPPVPPDVFTHRVRYRWEVRPPKLPDKAKPLSRTVEEPRSEGEAGKKPKTRQEPYDPPVFTRKGKTYVLLETPGKEGAARALADELGGKVVIP